MDSDRRKNVWDEARLADPHNQPDKASRVRSMFDAIAPTYELVNRVASAGQDARWRRKMVQVANVTSNDRLLDVACGTGDVARTFAAKTPPPERIVGAVFALEMLRLAAARSPHRLIWCQANALSLPFPDESFSLVTCAFGIRNFQDLDAGLKEFQRVLRPGGRAVILEFGMPATPVLRHLYRFYFMKIMPALATIISHDQSGAYRYLPQSVVSFTDPEGIRSSLCRAGFTRVDVFTLTLGVVSIYRATK